MRFLRLAAIGAALFYFFDRQQGPQRRAMIRDRVTGLFGGRRRSALGGDVAAETEALRRIGDRDDDVPGMGDDRTLKAKIESEVFRGADAPKGDVNVDVELGVVYLRGEVEDASIVEDLESRIRSIDGVARVESFVRTPGSEATPSS